MSNIAITMPELTPIDLVKISQYRKLMAERKIDIFIEINYVERRFIVKKNGLLGFIQKHKGCLFIAYKNNTTEKIDDIVNIHMILRKYNIFPEDKTFNIHGVKNLIDDTRRRKSS